jgi:hypothetical protein
MRARGHDGTVGWVGRAEHGHLRLEHPEVECPEPVAVQRNSDEVARGGHRRAHVHDASTAAAIASVIARVTTTEVARGGHDGTHVHDAAWGEPLRLHLRLAACA